jgi:hypothetical protein
MKASPGTLEARKKNEAKIKTDMEEMNATDFVPNLEETRAGCTYRRGSSRDHSTEGLACRLTSGHEEQWTVNGSTRKGHACQGSHRDNDEGEPLKDWCLRDDRWTRNAALD